MYQVKILPSAKHDIKIAAEWYNEQQKGLGKQFTEMVRKAKNLIQQLPNSSAIRYDEMRTKSLEVFPYMIH